MLDSSHCVTIGKRSRKEEKKERFDASNCIFLGKLRKM